MLRSALYRCPALRPLLILTRPRVRSTISNRNNRWYVTSRNRNRNETVFCRNNSLIANRSPAKIPNRRYADFPSHRVVKFPALSPTMEVGKIANWVKKVGDKINEGDLVVEIETDKATLGMESSEEGYLAKIILETGTSAPVGAPLFVIVENESDIAAFKDYKADVPAPASPPPSEAPKTPDVPTPAPTTTPVPEVVPVPATAAPSAPRVAGGPAKAGERVLASPMAKRLAEQSKIRLEGKGSGLFESITSKDLDKLFAVQSPAAAATIMPGAGPQKPGAPPPSPATTPQLPGGAKPSVQPGAAFVDIALTGIRSTIAQRLLLSKTTIPHYYLTTSCNADKLMEMRAAFNEKKSSKEAKARISVNDFMIKACAYACTKVPEVNSMWMEKSIRQFQNVDVCVAVATPTGLITPIVFNAHSKGIVDISKEVRELASRAKRGQLKPHEYQGGTITISNLGMFGVEEFAAIINPPQASILAVGTTVKRVVASGGGFKESNFITVTLSSDHRVADGAVGADWLRYFRNAIEDPTSMIL